MSQPWDPASEDSRADQGSGAGLGDRTDRGPSFAAPTWRPVESGPGPAMPQGRSGAGPDGQPTADFSNPAQFERSGGFGQSGSQQQTPYQQATPFDPTAAFPVVPPPSRRRRAPRPLIVGVAVLAALVLLIAADRVAAAVAGARTAAQAQSSYGLSESPNVHFGGFPFLTQLATSRFAEVDITAHDISVRQQSGKLVIDDLTASLHEVRPKSGQIRIGSLQGNALVGYQGVSTVVGRGVTYADRDADGGRVKIALTESIAVTAGLRFDPSANKFQVRDVKLDAGGQSLPAGAVEPLLNQMMAPVSQLPDGIRPTRVDVTPEGVRVHGSGEDLVFDR